MDNDAQNMPDGLAQGVPDGPRTFHLRVKANVYIIRPGDFSVPHPVGIGIGPGVAGAAANPIFWGAAANPIPNPGPGAAANPIPNPGAAVNHVPNPTDHLAGSYETENGREVRRSQRFMNRQTHD